MGLFGFIGKVLGIGGARSSKIEISKVSASAGLPIIYGKRRIEPITVFKVVSRESMIVSDTSAYDSVHQSYSSSDAEQSKNNDFLHRIDVWGQGIIEGIELFWLDGDAHTSGRFKSKQYFRGLSKFGSEIQGVATELAAGHSDWTIEHQGKGVAYTWTRFYNVGKKEQFDGEPEVEALVKGLKLYDPREGSHVFTDSATWVYSTNRALAVLNYLMGNYGFNAALEDLDMPSFVVAANACDAGMDIPARPLHTGATLQNFWSWQLGEYLSVLEGEFYPDYRLEQGAETTQAQYTLDAILDPKDGVVKNTKLLLEGMGWSLPWSNGKHKLVIEGVLDGDPVMHFDEDSIIGGWNVERGMRTDRLNRVTVEFPNANKEYKDDTVSWPPIDGAIHSAYKLEDQGQDLHTNKSVETITDFYRAQAYAEYVVRKSRVNPRIKSLQVAPKAMLLEPGDIISLYYEDKGFGQETDSVTLEEYDGTLFIVERVDVSAMLDVRLNLRKYDPTVYGGAALDAEPIPNSPYNPDWWLEPPAVTNIALEPFYETNADGTVIRGLDATWDLPEGAGSIAAVEVEWKKASDANYTSSMTLSGDSESAKISGLVNYAITFDVRVTYETQRGNTSAPAVEQVTLTVVQSVLDVLADGQLVFADFWDFGTSLMGWTAANATIETPSASASNAMGFHTSSSDANLVSPAGLLIDGSVWDKVIVRMKRLTASADNVDWEQAYLYYNTTIRSGFDPAYREFSNARYVVGKYVTFVFDMTELSSNSLTAAQKKDWIESTITQIQFAPSITAGDDLAIDWIGIGRVAPAVSAAHSANLVSDLGFTNIATEDSANESNFKGKTIDAMNVKVGQMISASIDVLAEGTRRGRLKLEFLGAGDVVISAPTSPWSTVVGDYAPVKLEGLTIPTGTERIRGKLERENAGSGGVGARYFTLNAGGHVVQYAPVGGATSGSNLYDADGLLLEDSDIITSNGQLVFDTMWDFGPTEKGWTGDQVNLTTSSTGLVIDTLTTDSKLYSPDSLTIDGSRFDKVMVRLKRISSGDGEEWEGPQLFYATTDHSISTSYRDYANAKFVKGTYSTFVFDMANQSAGGNDWTNSIITQLRFDPTITSGDDFEIDWIGVGRVSPSMAVPHAVNLIDDIGFKSFDPVDNDTDEVFAAKTLDYMNLAVGEQISASVQIFADGARRGRLRLEFEGSGQYLDSPWSYIVGAYQTIEIEGETIPPGTTKIRGVLVKETGSSGAVGARNFTLNRGSVAVPYSPVRGDVEEGATNTTDTTQLSDGAGLGNTAVWGSVSGTGRPADNATYNIGALADKTFIGTVDIFDAAVNVFDGVGNESNSPTFGNTSISTSGKQVGFSILLEDLENVGPLMFMGRLDYELTSAVSVGTPYILEVRRKIGTSNSELYLSVHGAVSEIGTATIVAVKPDHGLTSTQVFSLEIRARDSGDVLQGIIGHRHSFFGWEQKK